MMYARLTDLKIKTKFSRIRNLITKEDNEVWRQKLLTLRDIDKITESVLKLKLKSQKKKLRKSKKYNGTDK